MVRKSIYNLSRFAAPLFLYFLAVGLLSSCSFSFQSTEYEKAARLIEEDRHEEALKHLVRIIKRSPESEVAVKSARTGARVAALEIKDYGRAIGFYRHLVIHSDNQDERMEAQRRIAEIYFENLSDYRQSVIEYNKLLKLPLPDEQRFNYKLNIAKAYYQMNNFFQSQVETEELLAKELDEARRFEVMLFKGNVLLTSKKLDEAIEIFGKLIKEYPEFSKKENVSLNLAVGHEEKGELNRAIEILEDMMPDYPTPEFIELKIKRLKQRQANLPGAQGFRK